MDLTDVQHVTAEIAGQLRAAGITTVAALRRASDERVLSVTTTTGRVLKRIRLALEKLPVEESYTRWEFPDNPNGKMLLWRGNPDVWAQFKAGYYYTADEDEIAVLNARAARRHDIWQVSMDADAPRHAPTPISVPSAPADVSASVNETYLNKEND